MSLPGWQHGKLKRPEVAKLLSAKSNGAFLVRDSTKRPGDFVLSVQLNNKTQHFVITKTNGKFGIDDGPKYHTLEELVDFYKNNPASPTKLTEPVYREGYEEPSGFNNLDDIYGEEPIKQESLDDIYGEDPSSPPPPTLPKRLPSNDVQPNAPKVERQAASKPNEPTAEDLEREEQQREEKARKLKEQQQLMREAIASLHTLDEEEPCAPEGADLAYERERQFNREAMLTEKLNIFWLNNMLKQIGDGSAQVSNVKEDVKSGVFIMQVLAHLSGRKAPMYAKKPKMAVQFKDNWNAIVSFMRDLGIQVDGDKITGVGEEAEVDVSLNADLLADLERRELLKLFTKIMLYENSLE